jgi:hypothetical protein
MGDCSIRFCEAGFDGGNRFLPADPKSLRETLESEQSVRSASDDVRPFFGPCFFSSSSYRALAAGSQRQLFAAANSSSIRCQSAAREPGRMPRILAIWAAAAVEITFGCASERGICSSS